MEKKSTGSRTVDQRRSDGKRGLFLLPEGRKKLSVKTRWKINGSVYIRGGGPELWPWKRKNWGWSLENNKGKKGTTDDALGGAHEKNAALKENERWTMGGKQCCIVLLRKERSLLVLDGTRVCWPKITKNCKKGRGKRGAVTWLYQSKGPEKRGVYRG